MKGEENKEKSGKEGEVKKVKGKRIGRLAAGDGP